MPSSEGDEHGGGDLSAQAPPAEEPAVPAAPTIATIPALRTTRWTAPALVALLVLALALRLYRIGEQGVWIDEADSILIAQHDVSQIVQKLRLGSNPPLFYVLLHYWMLLVGDGSVSLRLLSAFSSVALVAATWWSARELATRRVAYAAALFVAVSPVQVYYSQHLRMYVLLPLFGLLATCFLARHLQHARRGDFALWLAATILALYTHNFAIYLLAVHGALILTSGKAIGWQGRWGLALLIGAAAYAPWMPIALEQIGRLDHYTWFQSNWDAWGAGGVLRRTLGSWSPGGEYLIVPGMADLSKLWRGVPALLAGALAGLGIWSQWRGARSSGRAPALWPAMLVVIPIAGALAGSAVLTPHYVPSRVDQMMLPAFAILVGLGIDSLRPAPIRLIALVALVGVGVASTLELRETPGTGGRAVVGGVERSFELSGSEAALAQRIAEDWRPQDVVVFTSLTRAPVEYYLLRAGIGGRAGSDDRAGSESRFLSFPADTAKHLSSQNDERWLADPSAMLREATRVMGRARALAGAEGRIFLVRALAQVNGPLGRKSMTQLGFREIEARGFFRQAGSHAVAELVVYRGAAAG